MENRYSRSERVTTCFTDVRVKICTLQRGSFPKKLEEKEKKKRKKMFDLNLVGTDRKIELSGRVLASWCHWRGGVVLIQRSNLFGLTNVQIEYFPWAENRRRIYFRSKV